MASRSGSTTETSPRPESTDTRTETSTNPDAGSDETAVGSPEAEGLNQESAWNGDSTNEIPDTDSRTTDSRQASISETGEPSRDGSTSSDSAWNDPQSNEITDADRNATGVEPTTTTPETGREHDTTSASSDTPNRSTQDTRADSGTPDTHHPGTDSQTGNQPDSVNEAADPESQSPFDRGTTAREAPADQTVQARDEAPGADDRVGDQTDGATDSRGEHPYRNAPDTYAESDRRDIENLNDSDQSGDAQPTGTEHTPAPSDHPANDDPPAPAPSDTPAGGDHNRDRADSGDDPKNPPDPPEEPERDKPEEADDTDALRAENADLRKQLAEAHATTDRLETTCGDLDDQRKAAEARAETLAGEVTELRGTVAKQSDQIAGLTGKVDEMSGKLSDVLEHLKSPDQALPTEVAEVPDSGDVQKTETPDVRDDAGIHQARQRELAAGGQERKKDEPVEDRAKSKELSISFATATVGVASTLLGHYLPDAQFPTSLGQGLATAGFAGIGVFGYLRSQRKGKSGNRPEG